VKTLTVQELAHVLRVSDATIYRGVESGRIPALRPSPHVLRFDLDAVLRALGTSPQTSTLDDADWQLEKSLATNKGGAV
jgi:excisionase family DNA binding protein